MQYDTNYGAFEILITCKSCGSHEVSISHNSDYMFDGNSDILQCTGNLDLTCEYCRSIDTLNVGE